MSDCKTGDCAQKTAGGATQEQKSEAILCEVFRSPKREGMYLYVDRSAGLTRVPDELLNVFGKPVSALVLQLTPTRRLAQADAREVRAAIEDQGFYLQMPPAVGTPGLDSAAPCMGAASSDDAASEGVATSAHVPGGPPADAH